MTPTTIRTTICLALAGAMLLALPALARAADAGPAPVPVSPGALEDMTTVPSPCPTFSWTHAPEADALEIVVYRLESADAADPEEEPPVLEQRLPSGAVSWTPAAERCLAAGEAYTWFVRAGRAGSFTPWSEGALFEVATAITAGDGLPETGDGEADPVVSPPDPRRSTEHRALDDTAPASAPSGSSRALAAKREPPVPASNSFQTSGHIAIGGAFKFTEPVLLNYLVPASAFAPQHNQEGDGWLRHDGYAFTPTVAGDSVEVSITATLLDLPDGARIVGFRCFVFDNVELTEAPGETDIDDLQIVLGLERRRRLSATNERIALVSGRTEGESSSLRTMEAGSFTPVRADRDDFTYWIEGLYKPESQGESLRFYGCELDLEVRVLDPR